MVQHFYYYIDILGTDGERHEIFSDDDFQTVESKFLSLAQLDLPVSISYETWWTEENSEE